MDKICIRFKRVVTAIEKLNPAKNRFIISIWPILQSGKFDAAPLWDYTRATKQ